MKKFNKIKKVIALLCILTVTLVTLPIGSYVSAATEVYLNISAPSNYNPKVGGSIAFTLTYTGDVANVWLDPGSIVLNGFTANRIITGTGNIRTVTLTNLQGTAGSKSISITGGTACSSTGNLSNAVTSSAFTISIVDTIAPVLTIAGPNTSKIYKGESITYVANYSDNIGIANIWLDAGSIVLNGFTANKSITGTGNTRTITLTNVQGTAGNKSISITGGTATDAVGNLSNSSTSSSFSLADKVIVSTDTIAPVLTITGPSVSPIYAGQTITYVARYTDDIGIANIWLDAGSIVLNGFTANVRISGTGNYRTVTLNNVQGTVGGNKSISITGGTAIDAAGNLSNSAVSAVFEIKQTPVIPVDPKPQDPPVNKPNDWVPNPNTGKY